MKNIISLLLTLSFSLSAFAQTKIQMQKENGVYYIPCKINDIPMRFVFDTGASDVTISLTEALFMLKNGNLKSTDIFGKEYYTDAEGEITEGTRIILRKIEVGSIVLYDVPASIVHNSDAPLLFGQSAINRFGKFNFDYSNSTITITKEFKNSSTTNKDDYYILCVKAVKLESDAKIEVSNLIKDGYKASYLWIPNYPSLSGKEYFCVYIGPFLKQNDCKSALTNYKKISPTSYGCLISKTGKKLRIN